MEGTYYIQAKGLTEFGTILDTGLIRFFIQYSIPSPTAILSAVNVPQKASIQLRSNIHAIFYTVGDENIKYIDDSSIDLRENHVNYNNGINVTGDFLLVVKLRNCNDYISPVVTIFDNTNTYQTGNINFKRYDSYGKVLSDGSIDWDDIELTKGYFNFEIETDFGILSLNTDMFEYPEDTGWIYTCLSRIGNLYDLIIILEDGTVIT